MVFKKGRTFQQGKKKRIGQSSFKIFKSAAVEIEKQRIFEIVLKNTEER